MLESKSELNSQDINPSKPIKNYSPFNTVPRKLLTKMFSYLKPEENCRVASVSKNWNVVSKFNTLWEQYCKEDHIAVEKTDQHRTYKEIYKKEYNPKTYFYGVVFPNKIESNIKVPESVTIYRHIDTLSIFPTRDEARKHAKNNCYQLSSEPAVYEVESYKNLSAIKDRKSFEAKAKNNDFPKLKVKAMHYKQTNNWGVVSDQYTTLYPEKQLEASPQTQQNGPKV